MRASFEASRHAEPQGFVYELDVRTKIAISVVTSIAVVVISNPLALGMLVLTSLAYVLSLGRFRMLALTYALIAVMWCMAVGFMYLLHLLWAASPAPEATRILTPFLRSMVMVNVVLAIALSSRIQGVLTTLKNLRLPFALYIPAAVMVRYVPLFIADAKQLGEALRTRGHRLSPLGFFRDPWLTTRLLFAPMVFRALRSADELGVAAELKGLGQVRRPSSYRTQRLRRRDYAAFAAALCCVAAGVAVHLLTDFGPGGMVR